MVPSGHHDITQRTHTTPPSGDEVSHVTDAHQPGRSGPEGIPELRTWAGPQDGWQRRLRGAGGRRPLTAGPAAVAANRALGSRSSAAPPSQLNLQSSGPNNQHERALLQEHTRSHFIYFHATQTRTRNQSVEQKKQRARLKIPDPATLLLHFFVCFHRRTCSRCPQTPGLMIPGSFSLL